jgi:hypothetical protein
MLYIKFDICNDAWLDPMDSLAGHEVPTFAVMTVLHVQRSWTLAGQMRFYCSQSGHENELPLKVVGAVLMCALSSILFLLQAEGKLKGA